MQPLQATAACTAGIHLALLIYAYIDSESPGSGAYVSTHLDSSQFFKVSLTLVVIVEQIAGATYAFVDPRQPETLKPFVFLSLAFATTGWFLLASFPEHAPEHLAGTAVYITFTSLYSLFFIFAARALKPLLLVLWALFTLSALAFASLHFAALYTEAAPFEWAAFTLYATTLLVFFVANPPPDPDSGSPADDKPESTHPLLPLPRS